VKRVQWQSKRESQIYVRSICILLYLLGYLSQSKKSLLVGRSRDRIVRNAPVHLSWSQHQNVGNTITRFVTWQPSLFNIKSLQGEVKSEASGVRVACIEESFLHTGRREIFHTCPDRALRPTQTHRVFPGVKQ